MAQSASDIARNLFSQITQGAQSVGNNIGNLVKSAPAAIQHLASDAGRAISSQPLFQLPGINPVHFPSPTLGQIPSFLTSGGQALQKIPDFSFPSPTIGSMPILNTNFVNPSSDVARSFGKTLQTIGQGQLGQRGIAGNLEDAGNIFQILPIGSITGKALSAEGKIAEGGIFHSGIPTQTEILNRAEQAAGRGDLYTQRAAKIAGAPAAYSGPRVGVTDTELKNYIQNISKDPQYKNYLKINNGDENRAVARVLEDRLSTGKVPKDIMQSIFSKTPSVQDMETGQLLNPMDSFRGEHARRLMENLQVDPGIQDFEKNVLNGPDNASLAEKSKPLSIPGDIASQTRAEFNTIMGNMGKGGVKGFAPEVRGAFEDWVNSQRASRIEGLIKGKEFSDLNSKGIQGIFDFQKPGLSGRLGEVKKYFDEKYNTLQKSGIEFGYKRDYLPQLWQNPDAEVEKVLGRGLGQRPSFTLQSVIKDYKTGIANGLTPRFTNISDLVSWYEQKANKALADKGFFDFLGKQGSILPASKAPNEWVSLDPDRFPKIKVNIDGNTHTGVYKAPPELAQAINNYLRAPGFKGLAQVADFVSSAKNRALSFGVPGTAINMHGINILTRHTLFGSGTNPISRLVTGANYLFNQKASGEYLDKVLSTAPEAVKSGLTLGVEDHNVLTEAPTLTSKFGSKWNDLFEKPLFNKMIPSLKLSSYNELVKGGMDAKEAAKLTNNVYGGINWEQLGKSRDMQNLKRVLFLAPDWLETNLKLGGNLAKAFTNNTPVAKQYRTMAANLVGAIVAINIANKISSGHYAFENPAGHQFEIAAGTAADGQTRYIRPLGTAADFLRIPFDAISGLVQGDPSVAFRAVQNRLSIPLGASMALLTNTDYRGKPIYGKDKFGNPMTPLQSAGGVAGQAIQAVGLPSFIKQGIDTATGKQGLEEGLTQGFELPVRYASAGSQLAPYEQAAQKASDQKQLIVDKVIQTLNDNNTPANEKIAILNAVKKDNDLYSRVVNTIRDKQLNVTSTDKSIRNLPIAQRATYVVDSINKASTIEEKQKLIKDFEAKGILTKSVTKEIVKQIRLRSSTSPQTP